MYFNCIFVKFKLMHKCSNTLPSCLLKKKKNAVRLLISINILISVHYYILQKRLPTHIVIVCLTCVTARYIHHNMQQALVKILFVILIYFVCFMLFSLDLCIPK